MNNGMEGRMELRNVVAIIPAGMLGKVEKQLQKIGVKGVTVTQVRGYGEHKDLLREDWLVTHARIEIFAAKTKADLIASVIMETAYTGMPGNGIVCILPVEKIYRIRTRSEAKPDEI
jgi:nitrogen regulatory protein P-II 1